MNEKIFNYIMLGLLSLLVASVMFGTVPDNRTRVDTLGDKLREAGKQTAGQSETIRDAERAAGSIEAGEQEALTIIRQCKRDLRAIRDRAEAQSTNP